VTDNWKYIWINIYNTYNISKCDMREGAFGGEGEEIATPQINKDKI